MPTVGTGPYFGGATVALVLVVAQALAGKAGMGISVIGASQPEIVMKNIIPVVMAGVLGIYGLIIAVIIGRRHTDETWICGCRLTRGTPGWRPLLRR